MSVVPGSRLGAYEIVGKLGAGGMGEVWRGRDTRLDRQVALKLLPEGFAADPERHARFEREARVLASLNHPNIAHLYGLEHLVLDASPVPGPRSPVPDVERAPGALHVLVMELVEGEDLAQRLSRGAIPIDEAIPIARQIAEALETAHEKGIVHRDLKPANVKVRPDGTVKVLDFGLAKALDPTASGATADLAHSPTITHAATQAGLILGTAAYMAPEQAAGGAVDTRADVWAFGVVLYEMLTGRRLFEGESVSHVLAGVLKDTPDLAALPAATPPRIVDLVRRCLRKKPRERLQAIGDARVAIDEVLADPHADDRGAARGAAGLVAPRRVLPLVAALPVVAAVAAVVAWLAKPTAPAPTVRLSIALTPGERVTTAPAISPDGRTVAYVAGRSQATARLFLRSLDDYAARPVDAGAGASWPFFSPDGRTVAFFANGKLWRVPVGGGTASSLSATPRAFGGSWGADGRIVYAPSLNDGLWRIADDGGKPERLTTPDDGDLGYAHVFPQVLPGGEILFTIWGKTFRTAVLSPASGSWRELIPSTAGRIATYAESGHLLIGDTAADLLGTAWRPGGAPPRRPETVLLDNVYWLPGTDRSWFAVSANGTAAFVPGTPDRRRLVWVDRGGAVSELPGEPGQLTNAALSRDGRRVAYNGLDSLWVVDLASGTRTRVVTGTRAWCGGWLPGDERIVFSSNASGDWDLYTVRAGGGEMEPLLKRPRAQHPMCVAPDGTVVFLENGGATGQDLWKLAPDGTASALVASPFMDWSPSVSPDGRWLAYMSDETGRNDVYAVPFSGKGDRVMVSVDGGSGPVWSRDGRELFYRAGDDVMSVEVRSTDPHLVLGERRRLLDVSAFDPQYFREFDVSADGQRFLFIRAEPESRPTRINVILNWFPELARKAAAK